MKPDGTPFTIRLQVEGDAIPTLARAGTVIAQQWQQARHRRQGRRRRPDQWPAPRAPATSRRRSTGAIETWGGHPDLSFFLESYHSEFIKPLGEVQPPRNLQRWQDPRLDEIIEAQPHGRLRLARGAPSSASEFLKLAVEEMPMIPLMAYNKFAPFDTTYWTGYPSVGKSLLGLGPELVEHCATWWSA